jgi:malate/lactate dehydrogenase
MANQDKLVMDQIKKDKNPKQKLSIQEIIKDDASKNGYDFAQIYAALAKKIESGKTRILRHGNSILIYNIVAPQTAEIHLATMDNFKDVVEAVKEFYKSLTKIGFKKAITTTTNPQIITLLKSASVPVKVSQKPDPSGKLTFELSFEA